MKRELQSILEYGLAETAVLLSAAFADYAVPLQLDYPGLMRMMSVAHVDAQISQVVRQDGRAVGVALVARRGWSCRLATMGIIPAARGQGTGKWLLAQLLDMARTAGLRRMELEVITSNAPGVALYKSCGFHIMRRLLSYRLPAHSWTPGAALDLLEIDIGEYARAVVAHGLPDLPWQLSGETVVQLTPPHRAYRCDQGCILISDPAGEQVGIRGLIVPPAARRRGQARRLLRALIGLHVDKTWHIPALCPEEWDGFWNKMGFLRDDLTQYQMERNW